MRDMMQAEVALRSARRLACAAVLALFAGACSTDDYGFLFEPAPVDYPNQRVPDYVIQCSDGPVTVRGWIEDNILRQQVINGTSQRVQVHLPSNSDDGIRVTLAPGATSLVYERYPSDAQRTYPSAVCR